MKPMSSDELRDTIEKYKVEIDDLEKLIDFEQREIELLKKRLPIITSKNKRLEPKYEFENTPEHLELQKEFDTLAVEKTIASKESQIRKLRLQINGFKREIEKLRKRG